MFDIGPEKLLVILTAVFIFVGPEHLPSAARRIGELIREVRSLQHAARAEMNAALSTDADENEPTGVADERRRPDEGGSFL